MTEMPQPDDTAEIDARLLLALARLNRRVTAEETALVRARIARQMTSLRLLRTVSLENGDEPAPGFNPAAALVAGEDHRS